MVLPLLGGSPAVWDTCLVFFQTALLLGYLYAHLQTTVFDVRVQTIIHLALLGCTFFFLPITPGWTPPSLTNPVPWLMLVLVMALGLPFALLSATSPLLQSWFPKTGKPQATDPYFLYSASNAGSLVGLLAYPVVIEPYFTLEQQSWAWSAGYAMIFMAILAGTVLLWGRSPAKESRPIASSLSSIPSSGLRLLLLAAVPSSLLQSVTSYLTLNLARGSSVVGHSAVYLLDLLHTGFQPETDDFSQVHGPATTGNPGLHDCRGLVVEPGVMVAVSVKSLGPFCYLYGLPWRIGEAETFA